MTPTHAVMPSLPARAASVVLLALAACAHTADGAPCPGERCVDSDLTSADLTDDSDPTATSCLGAVDDWTSMGGSPPLDDLATRDAYDAWQCRDDLARATTCPRYASTCTDASGDRFTFVLLHAGTRVNYAFFADDGTLAALYVNTDTPDYCGQTSRDLWLGRELVGCLFFDPFSQPECGAPLTCPSSRP